MPAVIVANIVLIGAIVPAVRGGDRRFRQNRLADTVTGPAPVGRPRPPGSPPAASCNVPLCGLIRQERPLGGQRVTPLSTATVLAIDRGCLVVVKHRQVPDTVVTDVDRQRALRWARQATEAEARWLAAARGADVVALHRVGPSTIETRAAGGATLRTLAPALAADPAAAARVLASVAATLDRLHRRRLVHGHLALDHLVLTGPHRNRPVLCSPSGRERDPAVDLDGLARLTDQLMAAWGREPPGWAGLSAELADRRHRPLARHAAHRFDQLATRRRLFGFR